MQSKKRIYLYPLTKITGRAGGNTYIVNLRDHLAQRFTVVNRQTGLGLLDVLLRLPQTDVIYFNWIEDVVDKRFGALQVYLLRLIVWLTKRLNIRIVWLVHNNLSHTPQNLELKKKIVALMAAQANVVLSHSAEAQVPLLQKEIAVFEHPVDPYTPLPKPAEYTYDLLIWGTVNPYKGVEEFLRFARTSAVLQQLRILVAGKFASPEYYQRVAALCGPNVTIENKILSDAELVACFKKSRCVLFTYNSGSVLSSGALCKTLSFGKAIIGPHIGSFKELGARNLIYTYTSFEALQTIVQQVEPKEGDAAYANQLQRYIQQHSWPAFVLFVEQQLAASRKAVLEPVA